MNKWQKYDWQVAIIVTLIFVVWMTAWMFGIGR